MSKTLAGFTITRSGEEYLMSFEDDDGEKVELIASYEQLDLIVEAIEEQLDRDEEDALGVDDEAEPA